MKVALNTISLTTNHNLIFRLNDITAVGKDSFYGTQDLEYRYGTVMSFIELGGLLALGKVWYFKGQDMKLVLSGLWGPNGMNVSPDLR